MNTSVSNSNFAKVKSLLKNISMGEIDINGHFNS